ncbi:MAG: hypothetical protein HRT81_14860 [Henriciella sp.]|nr:hypothetical protein [Henriciella sp.]
MGQAKPSSTAPSLAPTPQELFERLSLIATDLSETCTQVEDSLTGTPVGTGKDTTALQNLDRMTQNLAELSKLMQRLSEADGELSAGEIHAALQSIMLPSLKTFLEDGERQTDTGSVDLF